MGENEEIIMITGQGCPHCENAKNQLQDKINNGKIKVMDIMTSDEAMNMANQYNIRAVPSLIVKDKTTNIGEVCTLKSDLSGAICKNKEVLF